MDDPKHGLDDPAYAAFAWARFRRILGWMGVATIVIIAAALVWLDHAYGPLSWVTIVATVVGFGATIMLAAALMGLLFLSSGSGHDATIDDLSKIRKDRRRP